MYLFIVFISFSPLLVMWLAFCTTFLSLLLLEFSFVLSTMFPRAGAWHLDLSNMQRVMCLARNSSKAAQRADTSPVLHSVSALWRGPVPRCCLCSFPLLLFLSGLPVWLFSKDKGLWGWWLTAQHFLWLTLCHLGQLLLNCIFLLLMTTFLAAPVSDFTITSFSSELYFFMLFFLFVWQVLSPSPRLRQPFCFNHPLQSLVPFSSPGPGCRGCISKAWGAAWPFAFPCSSSAIHQLPGPQQRSDTDTMTLQLVASHRCWCSGPSKHFSSAKQTLESRSPPCNPVVSAGQGWRGCQSPTPPDGTAVSRKAWADPGGRSGNIMLPVVTLVFVREAMLYNF